MKIIDTTTFFDEKMMIDLRFNILNPYVDKFIVCESLFSHSGKKKQINFDINDHQKFKDKITHIILKDEPDELIKKKNLTNQEKRLNSIYRIRHQRNYIKNFLNQFSSEDLIIYSDNDEIPNFENLDLKILKKKKIIIFNQKLLYYKLNLGLPYLDWYGSKACKLKHLKTIDLLRNVKNREYSYFRIDTLFSDIKHQSVEIVKEGGWHFSNLKNPVELETKYLNDENHAEYELQNISLKKISDNIKNKVIPYNYSAKKNSSNKYKETKLTKIDIKILPKYINENIERFQEWII